RPQYIPFATVPTIPPLWAVHEIEDGEGDQINLDEYSVTITELPTVDGKKLTIEELFKYIRVNLDSFLDPEVADFSHYEFPSQADSERWGTDDYFGVIMVFRA